MGGNHDCALFFLRHGKEESKERAFVGRIEVRGGFVEQEQRRCLRQRSCQHHPLRLTIAQRVERPCHQRLDAAALCRLGNRRAVLLRGGDAAMGKARGGQHIFHRQAAHSRSCGEQNCYLASTLLWREVEQ